MVPTHRLGATVIVLCWLSWAAAAGAQQTSGITGVGERSRFVQTALLFEPCAVM